MPPESELALELELRSASVRVLGSVSGVAVGLGVEVGVGVGVGVAPRLTAFKASIRPQPNVLLGIVVPGMPPQVCEVVG